MEATVECPTDDQLGALVEHALDAAESARISAHLDACEACRAIVIAAVRGDVRTPNGMKLAQGTPSLPPIPETAVPFARPLVGTRLGRYEIRELLGKGGMGQVFAAYDGELERMIALKVLRPELARAASALADRLVRESRLMAKIAHPSVITVYDVGRQGDAVFVAMEMIKGETLGAYLARTKPGWREVAAIYERAGAGLAAAHDAGIVHRDFKPDNVLVEGDARRVVVTDFGIAMAAALADAVHEIEKAPKDARLTQTGAAPGTPAYMAPEQLAGGTVDRRADVFAFAVSLWEALFGKRPFPGGTVEEIRAAMRGPLVAPSTRKVPKRLVRALERGLAIDPARRWPDMRALLAELAAVRSTRRRTIALAAVGGAALVGLGIAGALVFANHELDPCGDRLASASARAGSMQGLFDPATSKRLDDTIAAWRRTHGATCHADRTPAQASNVAACLEARRVELEGFLALAKQDGAKAAVMARIMVDPARCADPRPGLAFARVPEEPALRRRVTDIRYRAFEIEAARDRSEFATAIPAAQALYAAEKDVWPPLAAELLYLVGTSQFLGGDNTHATATLREAAALADRVHHGYIAANCWVQLIQAAAFDDGDPGRALEYVRYADAAIENIGRPPDVEVLFLYNQGAALIEADRAAEAEGIMRRAVELATTHAPQYLSVSTLGLGYYFEERGRYAEAVETYRRALAELAKTKYQTSSHTFRERLALNLALLNQAVEAEATAREAVAIADKTLTEDNIDRATTRTTLAQVLHRIGKSDEALVQTRTAARTVARVLGERHERYGEVLSLEGTILVETERFAEAAKVLERACEIIAFGAGEKSSQYAECALGLGIALDGVGRTKEALPGIERAVEALLAVDGEATPRAASALVQRGAARAAVGRRAEAVADLERAIASFTAQQLEPGHLAGAKWALGRTLWRSDRPRAKKLIEEAVALFDKAAASWGTAKADAQAWLRGHAAAP